MPFQCYCFLPSLTLLASSRQHIAPAFNNPTRLAVYLFVLMFMIAAEGAEVWHDEALKLQLGSSNYLRQGGCVFICVCPFVCFTVSRLAEKLLLIKSYCEILWNGCE